MSSSTAGTICVRTSLWNLTGADSHIFGACVWILGLSCLFRRWWHPKYTMLVTFLLLLVYSLVKELWYDVNFETPAEAGQAWVDMVTYLSGSVLGLLVSLTLFPWYTSNSSSSSCCREYQTFEPFSDDENEDDAENEE